MVTQQELSEMQAALAKARAAYIAWKHAQRERGIGWTPDAANAWRVLLSGEDFINDIEELMKLRGEK